MMRPVQYALRKIKKHLTEDGPLGTVRWLWNCVVYQFNKRKPTPWLDYKRLKPTLEERKHLFLKDRRRVFIFGSVPYYDIGGGQRSAQLAKTFNRMGYEVYYYYCFKSLDIKRENYVPVPCMSHIQLKPKHLRAFQELVRKDDLMIMECPAVALIPYATYAKQQGAKVVYENIDNWETSLGDSSYANKQQLKEILEQCDLLVGTAGLLVQQLQDYCDELGLEKQIVYLANAVDEELFAAGLEYNVPKDMKLGSKTLLYYGSLWGEWFDWDLVYGIAKHDPTIAVNLIGAKPSQQVMAQAPENVHFLGLKRQTDLPAYLKHADFALVPFKRGAIGDYVSPLKMFEYISMGKNVLSTDLPDVAGYPNLYSGNTLQEWVEAVETAGEPDLAAAEAFTAANTWDSRIQNMLDVLYPAEEARCDAAFYGKISIIILNYNNKNIIDKCIASLLRSQERYGYEIVVVDNQSRDGSYEQIRDRFGSRIKLIRNSKNGCSSGRNLGVSVSTGDYIIFLDSDQWVTGKYWLDPYFDIYRRAPNFGAVGWAGGWFDREGKAGPIADYQPQKYMPPMGLFRPDIGYLGTGGMFLERSLFDEIEGFDEFYDPTCYEDTDLSLKIRHAGRELYYSRSLGVIHLPHQTTKSGTDGHLRLLTEKQQYFTKKWRKLNPKLLDYLK